jgi:hypothetical protein
VQWVRTIRAKAIVQSIYDFGTYLIYNMSVLPNGEFYLSGIYSQCQLNFGGTAYSAQPYSGFDVFVARYNYIGKAIWSQTLRGMSDQYSSAIATDSAGNVYLGGQYGAMFFINKDTLFDGDGKEFVVKLNGTDGSPAWMKRSGGNEVQSMACSPTGDIFTTGNYKSAIANFGSHALFNEGGDDMYVAKLSPATTGILHTPSISGQIYVFPNPANTVLNIRTQQLLEGHIALWYITGRCVYRNTATGNLQAIDISTLPNGLYLLKTDLGNEKIIIHH